MKSDDHGETETEATPSKPTETNSEQEKDDGDNDDDDLNNDEDSYDPSETDKQYLQAAQLRKELKKRSLLKLCNEEFGVLTSYISTESKQSTDCQPDH